MNPSKQRLLDGEKPRIALCYPEPTSYMLTCIEYLRRTERFDLSVFFWTTNLSAPWEVDLKEVDARVILPSGFGVFKTLVGLKELAVALWRGDYQVIMVEQYMPPMGLAAILVAMISGTPWVLQSDTQLLPKRNVFARIVKRLFLAPLLKRGAHFLPFGSRQDKYFQHYGVPACKTTIAKMTVDTYRIQEKVQSFREGSEAQDLRKKLGIQPDEVVILFVGRLTAVKGCDVLLEAFAMLPQCNAAKAHLLFVGDGEQRNDLQDLMDSLRVDHVYFAGYQRGDDLLSYYAIADFLVLPSWYEPWGLVINEGMAAGLPVVCTSTVGCVEDLVIHEKNGLVVPPRDVDALWEAIRRLSSSSELRARLGRASERIIARWGPDDYAQQVCGVFERCAPPIADPKRAI